MIYLYECRCTQNFHIFTGTVPYCATYASKYVWNISFISSAAGPARSFLGGPAAQGDSRCVKDKVISYSSRQKEERSANCNYII